jgi:hypothetical protein
LTEIVELKTPSRQIVRNPGRRSQFFAQLETDLSQLREYQQYFDSEDRRAWLQEVHGLRVVRQPRATLVIGSGEEDPAKIEELVQSRVPVPSMISYADVVDALVRDYERYFGQHDRLRASGFFLVGVLHSAPQEDRYILDVGSSLERNRVSLVASSESIRFEVRDRQGDIWQCTVPLSEIGINLTRVLHAEVGIGPNLTILTFRVNGRIVDRIELRRSIDFDAQVGHCPLFIGADLRGERGAAFAAHFVGLPARTIPLSKRVELMGYWKQTHPLLFPAGILKGDWVVFTEEQFLSTEVQQAGPSDIDGWAACYFAPTLGGGSLPAALQWKGGESVWRTGP